VYTEDEEVPSEESSAHIEGADIVGGARFRGESVNLGATVGIDFDFNDRSGDFVEQLDEEEDLEGVADGAHTP